MLARHQDPATDAETHFAVPEAHDSGVSICAEKSAFQSCAQRLRCVVDDNETSSTTIFLDCIDRRRVAEEVRNNYCSCTSGAHRFHGLGRQHQIVTNVRQHRNAAYRNDGR